MTRHRPSRLLMCTAAGTALLASGALAQQADIRVRAGEHPDYTRLVLDAPSGSTFSWGIEGDTLTLAIDGGARLDVSAAQQGLGLSRIDGLNGGARLEVALSCLCGARTMRLGDGRIVLDIAEGASRPPLPGALRATGQAESADAAATVADTAPAPTPAPVDPEPTPSLAAPAAQAQATSPTPVVPSPRPAPATPSAPQQDPQAIPVENAPPVVTHTPADPAPTPGPRPVQPLAETMEVRGPEQPAEAEPTPGTAAAPVEQAPPAEQADGATTEAPAQDQAQTTQSPGNGETPALSETERAVQIARNALIQQLRRAAEEGYVTLADPDHLPEPEALPEREDEADADSAEAPDDLPIRARTGSDIERASRAALAPEATSDRPPHCLPDSQFAVSQWTTDAPLMLQIGAHRRALVGEFDTTTPNSLLAYVRLLVASGFGREARGALEAFADQLPPSPVLADMGRLVDGDRVDSDGELALGLDCPGAHRLWASTAAALDGRLDPQSVDIDMLRDAVAAVPARLRTGLVLPIATTLLEAERITQAELLAGMAARAEPPAPDGDGFLTVLLARIDAARGDWTRAEASIEPLLNKTSPAGIEAMVRMVEFRKAQRKAAPTGLAENMEALAFTLDGTDLGARLLRAAAEARAAGQGLGLALAALKRLEGYGEGGERAAEAAREMLVDYTPTHEAGAAYAEAVITHESLIGTAPEGDRARLSIAHNLIEIGLGNMAEDILAPALERASPGALLLAARAATDGGEPTRALGLLEGLSGDRAARQRAAAHAALGNYAAAAEAAADTGDAVLEARYAWLAGNWAAASAAGDADRRILAAWMAGNGEMPAELAAAAADDPALAATIETFSPYPDRGSASLLEAAGSALEEARRRREQMGVLLEDG